MHIAERLWRADRMRVSRFHTARGTLCLNPADMGVALLSTAWRHATGRLFQLPWLTFPAIRFLRQLPRQSIVFEYGSGMSTEWYARQFQAVYAVEHDPTWFERTRRRLEAHRNAGVVLQSDPRSYVEAIKHTPYDKFDIIVIDGRWRPACVPYALRRLRPGAYLILDNSDVQPEVVAAIDAIPMTSKKVFPGFVPGIFHASETTVWRTSIT